MKNKKDKIKALKDISKKKPTFETETMRAWIPNSKEQKALKKETKKEIDEGNSFEVDIGEGKKVILSGFNYFKNKKTNEIDFAYKLRADKGIILIYQNPKMSDKLFEVVEKVREVSNYMGFQIKDIIEFIKENEHNFKALDKINKGEIKDDWNK